MVEPIMSNNDIHAINRRATTCSTAVAVLSIPGSHVSSVAEGRAMPVTVKIRATLGQTIFNRRNSTVGNLKDLMHRADQLSLHELEALYRHLQSRRQELAHKHIESKPHPPYAPGKPLTMDEVDTLIEELLEEARHDS